ncbi:hypothetical protein ACLOJK_026806 [Asimina triloba]
MEQGIVPRDHSSEMETPNQMNIRKCSIKILMVTNPLNPSRHDRGLATSPLVYPDKSPEACKTQIYAASLTAAATRAFSYLFQDLSQCGRELKKTCKSHKHPKAATRRCQLQEPKLCQKIKRSLKSENTCKTSAGNYVTSHSSCKCKEQTGS